MTREEIKQADNIVATKPRLLNDNTMHYCPGCSHGVVHKLVAEVIEEMGAEHIAIGIAPVGCAVMAYNYLDIDWIEAAHGRAPAIATAAKRLNPSRLVFTYQGDGDLAAIGTAETIHAANRGENIAIIFINNGIYGMTGGQMAPPSMLDGTCYVTRQSVHTAASVRKAKKALRKAFENSMAGRGTSVVEVVSTCNSGWKMTPAKANEGMEEHMFAKYPIGDLKDTTADQ